MIQVHLAKPTDHLISISSGPGALQYLLQMSQQYGELRPTMVAVEIGPVVWAPQLISTAFASWQLYCTTIK